jgi:hypothetical protein
VSRTLAFAIVFLVTVGRSDSFAWSCDGHRAVAILAQRLLSAPTLNAVKAVLTASPADPALRRICDPLPNDIIADVAVWADEQRAADPSTGGWHFINFPIIVGSRTGDHSPYCSGGNCVIDAIVRQFRALRTSRSPRVRANALRFVIHLIGDLHQPLHASTNGDRGGNCFPVAYFSQEPQEDDRGNVSPNLHGVWDFNLVRSVMTAHGVSDAPALADALAQSSFPRTVAAREPTLARVRSWAQESNALARSVAYGALPVRVPAEPATALTLSSCDDNNHIARRLGALHERIGDPYERTSRPRVERQLRLAAQRLAATLKAAFPGQ